MAIFAGKLYLLNGSGASGYCLPRSAGTAIGHRRPVQSFGGVEWRHTCLTRHSTEFPLPLLVYHLLIVFMIITSTTTQVVQCESSVHWPLDKSSHPNRAANTTDLIVSIGDDVMLDCGHMADDHDDQYSYVWCRHAHNRTDHDALARTPIGQIDLSHSTSMSSSLQTCFKSGKQFVANENRMSTVHYRCYRDQVEWGRENDVRDWHDTTRWPHRVFVLHVDHPVHTVRKRGNEHKWMVFAVQTERIASLQKPKSNNIDPGSAGASPHGASHTPVSSEPSAPRSS